MLQELIDMSLTCLEWDSSQVLKRENSYRRACRCKQHPISEEAAAHVAKNMSAVPVQGLFKTEEAH